jgi:hypothetical protein
MIWFRNPGIESKERTGKGLGWMQEQDSRAGYIHPLNLFFFFFLKEVNGDAGQSLRSWLVWPSKHEYVLL